MIFKLRDTFRVYHFFIQNSVSFVRPCKLNGCVVRDRDTYSYPYEKNSLQISNPRRRPIDYPCALFVFNPKHMRIQNWVRTNPGTGKSSSPATNGPRGNESFVPAFVSVVSHRNSMLFMIFSTMYGAPLA